MAFKVVAAGDSVVWGQGLLDGQKFHRLAAEEIAAELGEADPPSVELYARSGAITTELPQARPEDEGDYDPPLDPTIPLWQEAPNPTPTILQQVTVAGERVFSDAQYQALYGATLPEDAAGNLLPVADNTGTLPLSLQEREAVNLVIVNGGINDVNGLRMLLGGNHAIMLGMGQPALPTEELIAETRRNCYEETKFLIKRTRESFPNAVIVVVGYHYILSDESALDYARAVIGGAISGALAMSNPVTAPLVILEGLAASGAVRAYKGARRRGTLFHLKQLSAARRAVTEVYAERLREADVASEPGIHFVHPAFGARNAMYAPQSLIFQPPPLGAVSDLTTLAPNDPIAPVRDSLTCPTLPPGERIVCQLAALFHPTVAGARRIADAIKGTYLRNRRMSLRESAQELLGSGADLSLKGAFARHNLLADAETSVRDCMQHMVVDCLDVTLDTGNSGTLNKVSLRVNPNRTWHLNSIVTSGNLSNDELIAVNPFTVFPNTGLGPNSRNAFTIDPAEGGPQNRLRLGDLEEITLILQKGNPDPFDTTWDVARVQLAVNGRMIFDQAIGGQLDAGNVAGGSDELTVHQFV